MKQPSVDCFFHITSQRSPCSSLGQSKDWISFKNNQMENERLIGNITRSLIDKKVKDSDDAMTDEKIQETDNEIRAYATAMISDLNQV